MLILIVVHKENNLPYHLLFTNFTASLQDLFTGTK
jgi:hypothetical protein